MSVQAAKDFLKKLEAEPGFKAKFQEAPDQAARLQMAQAAGFDFNMDEFRQAVKEVTAAAADQELTPEQLQGVAGGWFGSGIVHDIGHGLTHDASEASEVSEVSEAAEEGGAAGGAAEGGDAAEGADAAV